MQIRLTMRVKCEKYFRDKCINPVLLNLNQCITHLRDVSADDPFMKFCNKKSDYQRVNFLSHLR